MQNKTILGLILVSTMGITPAFATDFGDQSHAQGNGFQCAASPSIETVCEIENILKFFFPQFLQIGQDQDNDLKQIIKNQQTEIELLKNMSRTSYKLCDAMTFGC